MCTRRGRCPILRQPMTARTGDLLSRYGGRSISAAPGSEFEHPTANAFVGEVEATLGKQLLDIAIAQGEAKVQPPRVLDDDRWKTMPAIGNRSHARSLRRTPPIQQAVFLTVPFWMLKKSRPSICRRSRCPSHP